MAQFRRKCTISKDGVLLVVDALAGNTLVPVLPTSLREDIIKKTHVDELGHFLGKRVFTAIAERCNWPGMKKDIQSFMRKCETCLKFNPGLRFEAEPGYFGATKPLEQTTFDVAHMNSRSRCSRSSSSSSRRRSSRSSGRPPERSSSRRTSTSSSPRSSCDNGRRPERSLGSSTSSSRSS
ncbi:hypothetical protein KC887_10295, partial [Candidatus Kaiserbacteria bacterium]|nr:hypothetical protein [Candidatus Kaiserbacteria bacterium]